jgi:hypothetical protein
VEHHIRIYLFMLRTGKAWQPAAANYPIYCYNLWPGKMEEPLRSPEPEFVNIEGDLESIPRNRFHQPM